MVSANSRAGQKAEPANGNPAQAAGANSNAGQHGTLTVRLGVNREIFFPPPPPPTPHACVIYYCTNRDKGRGDR